MKKMATRHREETVNTTLALLISKMGVSADAEAILARGQHRPDVLFSMRGLRVAIEGKFSDHPTAEDVVLQDARHRVTNGIAHIAAAAVYPKTLRTAATAGLEAQLARSVLRFKIVSEFGETADWSEGDPATLMDALRRAQESLAQDNVVEATANALSDRLHGVSQLWSGQTGACDRLGQLLGMKRPLEETAGAAADRRETVAKVAALVIANALIFQEQLSSVDERIDPLRRVDASKDPVTAAKKHWKWIWTNINYVPIFQLGERVVEELPFNNNTIAAFRSLLNEATAICSNQAALRHDLMGRIYHWLLHDKKYLGTYYTSVPAATLLLKLAIKESDLIDFGDTRQLASFKVADLACGTGTLLMAAAQGLSDMFINQRALSGRTLNPVNLQNLHRTLMENVLHGYDILPTAVHLTASTLALLAPEVSFVRMNLFAMPHGMDGNTPRLGSLDFMDGSELPTQFALDNSQAEAVKTGAGAAHNANATVPELDLCVMNPPFVRSSDAGLLFGSLKKEEREVLQKELKNRIKEAALKGRPSSATAGLGSVFVALADMKLKTGGRMAFVLPAALASGEAWAETRKLIAANYHLETVVLSHDAERTNFSENTDLSEVLFIAKKLGENEQPGDTTYVNLWRNPRSIHEALDMAVRVKHATAASVVGDGVGSILSPTAKLGELVTTPAPTASENWTGALFAQTELLRAFWWLQHGRLRIPGSAPANVSLAKLGTFGTLGYDLRDIHDAFTLTLHDLTPYPTFWNHEASKVTSIAQEPNGHLSARITPAPNRKLKSHEAVWSKAGRILLVERVRTNTHRVLAIGLPERVVGNTWWELDTSLGVDAQKALLLWLNSSLSLLSVFGRRVIAQGAWMTLKKPAWESMPVLDVESLDVEVLHRLATAYDSICNEGLKPLSQLDKDPVRARIDAELCAALNLPALDHLRAMLAREPGLSNKAIASKQVQTEFFSGADEQVDMQRVLF